MTKLYLTGLAIVIFIILIVRISSTNQEQKKYKSLQILTEYGELVILDRTIRYTTNGYVLPEELDALHKLSKEYNILIVNQ